MSTAPVGAPLLPPQFTDAFGSGSPSLYQPFYFCALELPLR